MENRSETTPPDDAARPEPQTVVLRGTAHLLATLPHLLGYHPGRSVVVMASAPDDEEEQNRAGSVGGAGGGLLHAKVLMTTRFDLPAPEEAPAFVDTLANPLHQASRGQAGPLLLHTFVYQGEDAVMAAVGEAVARLADELDLRLQDLVLVRDGHYLSVVGDGDEADAGDPTGWRPVPEPADVPAVADLVLRGRFAAASRDEVAAHVRRRDEPAAAATGLALNLLAMAPESFDAVEALDALGTWVVRGDQDPAPRDRARIAVALADRTLRDAVMARWLPRLFALEEVLPAPRATEVRRAVPPWPTRDAGALDRLLGLAARVPEADSVPLLTLAGAVAWGTGEGTVANEAVDRALELDPAYAMAALLREALAKGLPPWVVRRADVA